MLYGFCMPKIDQKPGAVARFHRYLGDLFSREVVIKV